MPTNLPNFVSEKHKHSGFYEVYTTISWRNFMCLRCVHGPKCQLRLLSPAALDIIINLIQLMGKCAMFHKRDWWTERMRWHRWNTRSDVYWYSIGIQRKLRSRTMLAANKPMFDHLTQTGGDE